MAGRAVKGADEGIELSVEAVLIDDMVRPLVGVGRDSSACRLVGRSHSPWLEKIGLR
jgi:hypothetical protein